MKVLRIYMSGKTKRKGSLTFWKKIFSGSLAGFLINEAKNVGIEQALIYKIEAGYLKGQPLMFDAVEARPIEFPICLELIDRKEKLDRFLATHNEQLSECRVVMLDFEEKGLAS